MGTISMGFMESAANFLLPKARFLAAAMQQLPLISGSGYHWLMGGCSNPQAFMVGQNWRTTERPHWFFSP
jgi:hypothetical protein